MGFFSRLFGKDDAADETAKPDAPTPPDAGSKNAKRSSPKGQKASAGGQQSIKTDPKVKATKPASPIKLKPSKLGKKGPAAQAKKKPPVLPKKEKSGNEPSSVQSGKEAKAAADHVKPAPPRSTPQKKTARPSTSSVSVTAAPNQGSAGLRSQPPPPPPPLPKQPVSRVSANGGGLDVIRSPELDLPVDQPTMIDTRSPFLSQSDVLGQAGKTAGAAVLGPGTGDLGIDEEPDLWATCVGPVPDALINKTDVSAKPPSAETTKPKNGALPKPTNGSSAASASASSTSQEGEEGVDGFIDDLLSGFDSIMSDSDVSEQKFDLSAQEDQEPAQEVITLFTDIAANYLKPVRNMMIELEWGEVGKEWVDICGPSVHAIKSAAEQIGFGSMFTTLEDFENKLQAAGKTSGATIGGAERESLIAAYNLVAKSVPDAFNIDSEKDRRESVIIHSLLLQVPNVRKVTIDKLYAAGLTDLNALFLAQPGDLSATTGIPLSLAMKLVEKFQAYRTEARSEVTKKGESSASAKVKKLADKLRAQQNEFKGLSKSWDKNTSANKKRLRRAREETLLQINIALAQLGHVVVVKDLERLTFDRKTERLDTFFEELDSEEGPAI